MSPRHGLDGFARWRGVSRRSRVGILLLVALFVPVGVVALVGVASLRNEALAREHLLAETYRQVAEIVAARLDDRIAAIEAEVAAELSPALAVGSLDALIEALHRAGDQRPWLRPAVVVRSDGKAVYPPESTLTAIATAALGASGAEADFQRPFDAAAAAELRDGDLRTAVRLYRQALDRAPGGVWRARALNGLARCEYKAANYRGAITAYERLIDEVSPWSPEQANLALIAHRQRAAAAEKIGDHDRAAASMLDLYAFLIAYSSVLDDDLSTHYRRDVEHRLGSLPLDDELATRLERHRLEERKEDEESALRGRMLGMLRSASLPAGGRVGSSFAIRATASSDGESQRSMESQGGPPGTRSLVVTTIGTDLGATATLLAHEWRFEHLEGLLGEVLAETGPWQEASVSLEPALLSPSATADARAATRGDRSAAPLPTRSTIDLLPGWHVVARPAGGTVASLVTRDVRRYALLLGMALVAIVVAVTLGARSLSREMSLVRLRTQFVSSVSHELRTPLSLIRAFTESLEEGWIDDARRAETYAKIRRETERLSGLIDNVLDFSRLESGTREFDFTEVDLDELVAEISQRLAPEFEAAGVTCSVESGEPVRVRADRDAIERVLVNLLSNAVKYIGEGERRVTVASCVQGGRAGFRVTDTGIGIAATDLDRVFERHHRAGDARARSITGSGIGLTVSKGIVDAHGGEIEVRSTPEEGSTFTVWLPRVGEEVR